MSLYQMGIDGVGAEDSTTLEADKLVSQVKANYERLLNDNRKSWTDSAATNSNKGSIERLGGNIDLWATTLRDNAIAGKKASGRKYSWTDWTAYGQELNADMRAFGDYAVDTSQWNAMKLASGKTIDDVKQGAIAVKNALPSSNTLIIGGLVLGGLGLIYVANKLT